MDIVTPPTTPTLTTAQAQAKLVRQTRAASTNLFNMLVTAYNTRFDAVWNNADGLTPQQAFDAFGTDAVKLVTLANTLVTAANAAIPDTLSGTTPHPLTVNNDGTVTVGS